MPATEQANYPDIAAMSFEQALKELEGLVRKLEGGQKELDSMVTDFARGTALKNHCQRKLADARMKVEKIIRGPNGDVSVEPFDPANQ